MLGHVYEHEVPELEEKLKEVIRAIKAQDSELRRQIFDEKSIEMKVDEVAVTLYKTDNETPEICIDDVISELNECGINSRAIYAFSDSSQDQFREEKGIILFFDVAQLKKLPFKNKYQECVCWLGAAPSTSSQINEIEALLRNMTPLHIQIPEDEKER